MFYSFFNIQINVHEKSLCIVIWSWRISCLINNLCSKYVLQVCNIEWCASILIRLTVRHAKRPQLSFFYYTAQFISNQEIKILKQGQKSFI